MTRHTHRSTSALTFTLIAFAALLVPSVGRRARPSSAEASRRR